MKGRRAVCLVSGGLDSAVAATIAKCERFDLYCLTIDYGQRQRKEIEHAKRVAEALRAKEHRVFKIPLSELGGSALTDLGIAVPKGRSPQEIGVGIPATYVPARNTVFLSLALAYAEVVEADAVFFGAHTVDYSGYPDCRPEFVEAFQNVARLATKRAIEKRAPKIHAPLLTWDKARIITTGLDLRAPLEQTWSCYEDGELACGRCDACQIRRMAFAGLGKKDPVAYADGAVAPSAGLRLVEEAPLPPAAMVVPQPRPRARPTRARPAKPAPRKARKKKKAR